MTTDARLAAALALYPLVFRRALHLTEHWHDAEDLTQTVYLKLCPAMATLDARADSERGMKAVLLRTTDHAWFDELRKRKARAVTVPQVDDERAAYAAPDSCTGSAARLDLQRDLSRLPPEQVDVVLALYVDGWSLSEVARRKRLSRATVKDRARLGRERLRDAA